MLLGVTQPFSYLQGDLIIEVQCVIEAVTKFVLLSKNRNVEISASDRWAFRVAPSTASHRSRLQQLMYVVKTGPRRPIATAVHSTQCIRSVGVVIVL